MPQNSPTITPRELGRQIGVDPKTIRKYLRSKFGKLGPFTSRWLLDEEKVEDVRRHFSR